ncbi:MAG: protease complex subunit PrcB family protein [Gemmataceae bacterium]|nr:protease complex subunit PrcB family protein [Gemmataceae bacterium]
MLTLVLTVLTGLAAEQAQPKQAPLKKELFASEGWYKNQKGEEQTFVGVLRRLDRGKDVVGIGRFNPYRLEMDGKGKKDVREVYVGGKMELLAPYVGKRVKLIGKAVEMEVVGRNHREIWPARLEVLPAEPEKGKGDGKDARRPDQNDLRGWEWHALARLTAQDGKPAAGKPLKILAKAPWTFAPAKPDGPKEGLQKVIRQAVDLANLHPWNQLDAPAQTVAKTASAAVAKALKVDAIDWDKQMLVIVTAGVKPTGGWKVEIASVTAGDKSITVNYDMTPPKGFATQAFTHPGQVALVERAEGMAKFVPVPGKAGRPKLKIQPRLNPPVNPALAVKEGAGEKSRELKVFARTPNRLGARGGNVVVRGPQEMVKLRGGKAGGNVDATNAAVAKLLKVEKIDWDKQMIILISGGTQRTGGYSVELKGLKVQGDTLTVQWKLNAPKAGQPVTQALTNPGLALLVERFDGEVRFDPPAAKSGLDRGADR